MMTGRFNAPLRSAPPLNAIVPGGQAATTCLKSVLSKAELAWTTWTGPI